MRLLEEFEDKIEKAERFEFPIPVDEYSQRCYPDVRIANAAKALELSRAIRHILWNPYYSSEARALALRAESFAARIEEEWRGKGEIMKTVESGEGS